MNIQKLIDQSYNWAQVERTADDQCERSVQLINF